MNTWSEFWGLVIPVFWFGIAIGCVLCRALVDIGVMHP
jgi:hypothetical protein